MSIYGAQKLIHHLPLIHAIGRGETVSPVHVQLIVSDLCNQDCNFCAYRMSGYTSNEMFVGDSELAMVGHNNPVRMLERDFVLAIIEDCRSMGVKAIQFTGGGEPTVHPHIAEFLAAAKDAGLEFSLVTNGLKMDDKLRSILQNAAWVRVSLDSASAEKYSEVRRVSRSQFARATENIRLLAAEKKIARSNVIIGVGFVVTADNWREIADCAKLARQLGADNMRISAVFQSEGESYFSTFRYDASALCEEARGLQTPEFSVFDNFGDRVSDLKQGAPDYSFCGYQFVTTYIGGDMNVYRCCGTSYSQKGLLGSIKSRGFRDFWFSSDTQEKLKEFNAGGCLRCQFNGQNRFINHAIAPAPPHANFT